ncbi:MAG: circadian clock protein KaiC [Ginsengibacter sp.]
MKNAKNQKFNKHILTKSPTGITGLDEITNGGLPAGRPTLICGDAGTGKTLMSIEFIVNGVTKYNEPGVFVAFEEKSAELATNVASLGFDLNKLTKEKKLRIDTIAIDRSEIEETGEYDLEGLFIRLAYAIDSIGAKRIVLDTIENLFSGLENEGILRAELRRLFRWLKDKGVTAIITGEKGEGKLTRQGLEEYVSDCVIVLDHRIQNQISTRRLRVLKYRGSVHGTNEYPFLIDEDGISVLPVTSLRLNYPVSKEKVPTGIPGLDEMLSGEGYYKGSSILVSGAAGTGKTSIAALFAKAACQRKERCLYFAFEESPQQIIRNMRSIGLDLEPWEKKGLLKFYASRPTIHGLEMHLVVFYKQIKKLKPSVVIIDPITNLVTVGDQNEVKSILIRLLDFLQQEQITIMFTALSTSSNGNTHVDENVSSLIDTWISIQEVELNGERNRCLNVLKSRGMKSSNQVREFKITDNGVKIAELVVGPDGMVIGSAQKALELQNKKDIILKKQQIDSDRKQIEQKKSILKNKIQELTSEFEIEKAVITNKQKEEELSKKTFRKKQK